MSTALIFQCRSIPLVYLDHMALFALNGLWKVLALRLMICEIICKAIKQLVAKVIVTIPIDR